jgi:hypothetical protein
MKIIKKVDVNAWRHLCNCVRCDSKLEVEVTDLKCKTFTDGSKTLYFNCPVCYQLNYIAKDLTPRLVQMTVEAFGEKNETK